MTASAAMRQRSPVWELVRRWRDRTAGGTELANAASVLFKSGGDPECILDESGRPTQDRRLVHRLTDPVYVSRAVRFALGLPTPLHTEDRHVLEHVIFPHYLSLPDLHRVLFVGVDWYTRHYPKTYFRNCEYWTIDSAPAARKFASRNHVLAAIEDLDQHFPPAHFDIVFCNGVYGHGLNTKAQCEQAFSAIHSRLKPGGHLVLGWNDVPEHRPVPLASIESLAKFTPAQCSALGTHRFLTDTPYRHTYDFYRT
jgi:hypothetical protein